MANAVNILNTVRANASDTYKNRIPVATQNNLDKISTIMGQYVSTQNEFLNALVNRIAMTIVNQKMIENPISQLKSGTMPMGKDIEEIFTNPAIAKEYKADSADLLKVTPPDVKALFYTINRQDKYPVTISTPNLMRAFTSNQEMGSLISQIVNSLYSGDNYDEFLLMKQLMADAVTKENVVINKLIFKPDTMTDADAKTLVKILRADSMSLTFASSSYNKYAKVKPASDTGKDCITFTPVSDQVLLIDARVYSNVNVDVLASAFNMDKADFIGKVIPVDNFNGAPVMAMLMDKAWFRVYDVHKQVADMFNGDTLNHSYWLHHWQVLGYSMFANAIAYTYEPTP